jgi:hypothetical protein
MTPIRARRAATARRSPPASAPGSRRRVEFFIGFSCLYLQFRLAGRMVHLFTDKWFGYEQDERVFMRRD